MIPFPFKFRHVSSSVGVVYTAESMDEHGLVTISWLADHDGGDDYTTYSSAACHEYLRNGTWVLLEPKIDLRTSLKIRLFEMRIADMEKNLISLKREFEMHKQDVKGTH